MPREALRLPETEAADTDSSAPEHPSPAAPRTGRRAAREIHTDDMPIDQKAPITDADDYEGEIVRVDKDAHLRSKDFLDELKFMEEPVTIRIEPSTEKNAAMVFPVWVNGKGAEVFERDRWFEIGYLPVGRMITVRRKAIEVIVRAKVDAVTTDNIDTADVDRGIGNTINRRTSAVHSFSVIEDRNPKGAAWLTEMRRRNF